MPAPPRTHLRELLADGLVAREAVLSGRRGRPEIVYTWRRDGATKVVCANRRMSRLLAERVEERSEDLDAEAQELGRRWGRSWDDSRRVGLEASRTGSRDEALTSLVEVLDQVGFEPQTDAKTPREVHLRKCPFLDLVGDHPEQVCNVYLGLMREVLDRAKASFTVTELRPFVTPTCCVAVLDG